MKTIAVANQKGGVAKSTTCWEIGTCLKDMGYKVLVIDFDQQSNLTGYVNADRSKPSIYDCLKADASMEDAIQVTEDFDFISASEKLSKADKEFSAPEDIYLLKELLKFIEDDYDFAIVDNSEISFEDWVKIDELFGLRLITNTPNIDEDIYVLIHEREDARAEKDFATSDGIRDELLARGIALRDTPGGAVWEYTK